MAKRARKPKDKAGAVAKPHLSEAERLKRQRVFVESITRLAEPLCRAEGIELVHVEYQREPGGLTLRIYLDRPGGVTLDDCVEMSRQLEDILDVHAGDLPPYRLEVSSPGIDRPVGRLADFTRFKGHRAKIRVVAAIDGRKNFTGILAGVVDTTVLLQVGNETVSLEFNDITRARLINYNGEH
ncbi:ribosome maturation factor RimP [Desulfosarcina ovata]|uniref:Ribosome maturation factor RimP n=2 Tax=Desulfosarcina ovata TaxID=83564 RepID=A0A5K8AHE3_9BACT|nr:ribosome maturation factor RimP [Desulfosarcina ovata]BBO85144.1 ribosome maturation factor [Desulfosarcina ovata subsp. sediminis]BBO91896.1 ribosome maturation factor [Desulfosarcina ovata subsp. ovata]